MTIDGAPRALKGELKVAGDPRVSFSDADRRSRQAALMDLYGLIKALGSARAAATSGLARTDGSTHTARRDGADPVDALRAVQARIGTLISSASGLSRSIEGYSGVPTADQRRQIDWAFDDGRQAMDALNRALQTEGAANAEQLSIPKRQ